MNLKYNVMSYKVAKMYKIYINFMYFKFNVQLKTNICVWFQASAAK
jgi:hypothetical protein